MSHTAQRTSLAGGPRKPPATAPGCLDAPPIGVRLAVGGLPPIHRLNGADRGPPPRLRYSRLRAPRGRLSPRTTHRPNELALKMDGAQACYLYLAVRVEMMP